MFRYDIQQNQWLIASLAVGLALLATFVLGYLALWLSRPPAETDQPEDERPAKRFVGIVPWVLLAIWLGVLTWGLIYTFMQAASPPNW